jgi:hypothetical protein
MASGRVWTSVPVTRSQRGASVAKPARDQTVLKRLLRRLSG